MPAIFMNKELKKSMIGFPLVIANVDRDIPGIEPGPPGWYTSALNTGLRTRSEECTETGVKFTYTAVQLVKA
jgi:hypothetical protein